MEYLVVFAVTLNLVVGLLALLRRRGTPTVVSTDIHDHEAHDAGVISELRDLSRSAGGRVHLHDIEAVMRRRRDRRRREA